MQTFPSNPRIVAALLVKFEPVLTAISYRMGIRYRLTAEDREDLVSHGLLKIAKVDWRLKLKANQPWIEANIIRKRLTPEDAVKVLTGYTYSLVKNSLRDECHRIKSGGLGGLLGHKLSDLPFHDEFEEEAKSSDFIPPLLAEKARTLLTESEWGLIFYLFGFDGHPKERTIQQAARELKISRKLAQELCNSAMAKLRSSMIEPPAAD